MSESGLQLVSFSVCPYVQRARIVMLEKEIPHTIEYINLQAPPAWFHEISPLEKVPVLMVGEQALFESLPICEYLDEISPGSMYPDDPLQRARQRGWMEYGNDMLEQIFKLIGAPDAVALKQAQAVLEERLDILEEQLEDGAPFFAGQDFGMVDAVFAPIFRILREIQRLTDLILIGEDLPKVANWSASVLECPSVKAAVPESYPVDYEASLHRRGGEITSHFKK